MAIRRRDALIGSLSTLAASALPTLTRAQPAPGSPGASSYPTKALRVLVPYAAGGSVDFAIRAPSQKLGALWGQAVVIDNKPGGATNIAAQEVLRAPHDGYTLFAASRANAINASINRKKLSFDIQKDFVPISVIADIPNVLVVDPRLPVRSLAELVLLAKSKPGQLSYASAGTAGSTHLAGELFKSLGGVDVVHVPYKGGSQAVVDVVSGQVAMYFGTMPSVMAFVRSGKLRALAVTSAKRSAIEPSLPTMSEAGMPGYKETSWIGLMAPAGTPAAVIEKLHRDIVRVMAMPDVRAELAGQGADVIGNSPAEFAEFLKSDIATTAALIEKANISAE